jgi:hypothetical protein
MKLTKKDQVDEIKEDQVWITKSGNVALIVKLLESEETEALRLMWYDTIDEDLVISKILDRLGFLVEGATKKDFYKAFAKLKSGNCFDQEHLRSWR